MHADTEHLEAILQRYSESRLPPPAPRQRRAIAADGKRIRFAKRHGSLRYETATLVEHGTGVPLASLNFDDENGELAAVGALLETGLRSARGEPSSPPHHPRTVGNSSNSTRPTIR